MRRHRRRRLLLACLVVAVPLVYMSHSLSEPKSKRILLVSYGRSGSTFTSYILSQTPGTFFFFEPLRPHVVRTTAGYDVIMSYNAIGASYQEAKEQNITDLSYYEQGALKVLRPIFDCDIQALPVSDLMSNHLSSHGDTKTVCNCLGGIVRDSYLNLPHYLQCLVDFWRLCKTSSIKLVKVIRLPLRSVFSLLRQYPDLYLVYLVRDPRATLFSQQMWFGHAPAASDFCPMVADDIEHMRLLQDAFPDRTITVRYEDIADDPYGWTRLMYKVLGLPVTRGVLRGLGRLINSSGEDEGGFSVFRSNPRLAANTWRTEIDSQSVRETDSYCRNVYHVLGYKMGSDEDLLRNISVPMKEDTHGLARQ